MMRTREIITQPKTPSAVAVAAWFRHAGPHGGTSREQHKRSRKQSKLELRDER